GEYLAVVFIGAARPLRKALAASLAARMLLPVTRRPAILARTAERRTVGAILPVVPRAIEARMLAPRPIELRLVERARSTLRALVARTRETRSLLTAALVARPVEARFVEWTSAPFAAFGIFPRLLVAAIPPLAEILARAILAESALAARRVGTLLAAAIVARAKILARPAIRPIPATRRALVAAKARRTRIVMRTTRSIISISPRRAAVALGGVGLLAERLVSERSAALNPVFGLAGVSTPLAVRFTARRPLGEFLLGPPLDAGAALACRATRRAGTAFACRGPVAPAARGGVVFIAVAGHE
ncbi:MAG: hypothetical protein WBA29_06170, partial [Xanthobacteraceae bacterium]